MKPSLSLLLVLIFAIQAFHISSTSSHLDAIFAGEDETKVPHQRAIQVLFNLPTIITGFLEYQDTLRSLSQLYQYYLNSQTFENLLFDFFRYMDTNKNAVISLEEFQKVVIEAEISRVAADRVYNLAALDNPSKELGFGDFKVAMELFFSESISEVSFAYMLGGPSMSENVGINLESLIKGMQAIFEKLNGEYPKPGCDQLEYLFREFDKNGDNMLNPEEFYHVLAIFLKYYKTGLNNFRYSKLVHRDNVFELLWEKQRIETAKIARRETIFTASSDYFQLAVFEKILNSVGHDIFQVIDANHNGVLELDEFKNLLSMFSAPESEAVLLFTTADADGSGSVDYGEFLVTFETFVRRALASLIYNLIKLNEQAINLDVCQQVWRNVTTAFGVDIGLTDDGYKVLFESLDTDKNGELDNTEFAQFTSAIITTLKKTLRQDIDAKISVVSGLNASTSTIGDVFEEKMGKEANANVTVAQGIIARILSKTSVVRSAYTSTTITSSDEKTSSTTIITTTNDEFEETAQKTYGFIDLGIAPGSKGFAFTLFDVVQESLRAFDMDTLPKENNEGEGAAFGVLLQGKLKNIGKGL